VARHPRVVDACAIVRRAVQRKGAACVGQVASAQIIGAAAGGIGTVLGDQAVYHSQCATVEDSAAIKCMTRSNGRTGDSHRAVVVDGSTVKRCVIAKE